MLGVQLGYFFQVYDTKYDPHELCHIVLYYDVMKHPTGKDVKVQLLVAFCLVLILAILCLAFLVFAF
jgi:hypothetical protein